MSYTVKVILASLGGWLFLSLVGGVLSGASSGGFVDGFLIAGMFFGLVAAATMFIVGFVVLIGKMGARGNDRHHAETTLDGKAPERISYTEKALAFFAAAGLILLVGASVCFSMVL